MKYQAVVIGASAGGLEAFTTILSQLSSNFQLPIFLVQHLLDKDDSYLAKHLNKVCSLEVIESADKQSIEAGKIYVTPPGFHMLIESTEKIALSSESPVNFARPSIDLLFQSAADVYKRGLIGVLLTGANRDGAEGLYAIHQNGGVCVVQDPHSAAASVMPESAIKRLLIDYVLTPDQIATCLNDLEVE